MLTISPDNNLDYHGGLFVIRMKRKTAVTMTIPMKTGITTVTPLTSIGEMSTKIRRIET